MCPLTEYFQSRIVCRKKKSNLKMRRFVLKSTDSCELVINAQRTVSVEEEGSKASTEELGSLLLTPVGVQTGLQRQREDSRC